MGVARGPVDGSSGDVRSLLDDRQERYLAWLLTPPPDRVPESKNKLAAELGVAPRTLRGWEEKRAFRERWEREAKLAQADPEKVGNVMNALYEKALRGDTNAAKAWLQANGAVEPPKVEVTHRGSARDLSDDELRRLVAEMAGEVLVDRSPRLAG